MQVNKHAVLRSIWHYFTCSLNLMRMCLHAPKGITFHYICEQFTLTVLALDYQHNVECYTALHAQQQLTFCISICNSGTSNVQVLNRSTSAIIRHCSALLLLLVLPWRSSNGICSSAHTWNTSDATFNTSAAQSHRYSKQKVACIVIAAWLFHATDCQQSLQTQSR
jgi:hypothetical protein